MDKFLRKPQIKERVGLSPTQIYRLEKAGDFPQRVQLGANSVAWLESEITAWIEARAQSRTSCAKAA